MTTVTFSGRDGFLTDVRISGHSGYAVSGSDIVCASISAMTNLLVAVAERKSVVLDCSQDAQQASVFLAVRDGIAEGDLLFRCFLGELEALAEEYPRNVRIIMGKED